MITAWVVIAAGAILFPLPVPLGAPLLAIGFFMLVQRSKTSRLLFGRLRLRYPGFSARLKSWAKRGRPELRKFERATDPLRLFKKRKPQPPAA